MSVASEFVSGLRDGSAIDLKCVVCERLYEFRWTDTHGVAVCRTCGLPYRLYHYDEHDKRLDKAPEVAVIEAWVAVAKRYWIETSRRVLPGVYDIGILRSRGGRTYSGASEEDCEAFSAWLDEHHELIPPNPETREEPTA